MNTITPKEIVLIVYEDIIKTLYPHLLNNIKNKEVFNDYLNLNLIKDLNLLELYDFCFNRKNKNIFIELSNGISFDYNNTLKTMIDYYPDIYLNSKPLKMHSGCMFLSHTIGMRHVYVYVDPFLSKEKVNEDFVLIEDYDRDMKKNFNMNKITLLQEDNINTFSFKDCIMNKGITTFIVDTIEKAVDIINSDYDNITILIANYNYNFSDKKEAIYKINLYEEIKKLDKHIRFGVFDPY